METNEMRNTMELPAEAIAKELQRQEPAETIEDLPEAPAPAPVPKEEGRIAEAPTSAPAPKEEQSIAEPAPAHKEKLSVATEPVPAMKVKELSFAYGKNRILKNISLSIPEGKITTILGANGCGKSTLFSLMTKNLTPDKGKILLGKKNIRNLSLMEFARKVSIVHQYNSATDDITVEKLVSYGRTPHMKMLGGQSEEDKKLIDWAISVTNLEEYRDREVSRLSGGQRQRVWIAMALAQNTGILFLDEPTTYLDIRYQLEILELVRMLNREYGITIVMVLHDINQAIYFSHEIIGLKDGKVAVAGDPQEVITKESIRTLYGIELEVEESRGKKFVLTV